MEVLPKKRLHPCTHAFGYVYIVGMHFKRVFGLPFYCIRVFGSASVLPGDPLKVLELTKLPLKKLLSSSTVQGFAVLDCQDALHQIRQGIATFHQSWKIQALHGEECYRHIDDEKEDIGEEARNFVASIYDRLLSPAGTTESI